MDSLDTLLDALKTLHPKLIDLSLGRTQALLAKLGHPERRLPPVIHVAGTNGKGSVTAYLAAMLRAAGKRVHVYTSPHLVRFNERIALGAADGTTAPISEPALAALLARVMTVNGSSPITFFEITTAAAFLAFAETPADALVLEVGLGGRFDATNVVEAPRLAVITPISMDHADKLGDTLEKIAFEKAGILKRGCTAVVSQQPASVHEVIAARARDVGASLTVLGRDFDAYAQGGRLVVQCDDRLLDLPLPALIGRHQIVNAGTAVAAALQLPELGLDERAIARGLQEVRWPARMQRITHAPLLDRLPPGSELWLDGGHNPAAGDTLALTLADLEEKSSKPLFLIVGMMGTKDAAGFLAPFKGLAAGIVTVPLPRAHEPPHAPEALARAANGLGFASEPASDVDGALAVVRGRVHGPVRVLICGSLYLAGALLASVQGLRPQSN